MKKTLIILALASLGVTSAHAAVDSVAVATWQATAKKDTTSSLVVTPLTSLSFQYAEGVEEFNTVNGLFDVSIMGRFGDPTGSPYTDFTLKAKKLSSTLNHLSGGSTVEVGVMWQGVPLTNTGYTALIDTANGVSGGTLSSLSSTFNVNERSTAQGSFNFFIESATVGGSTSSFSALPDGLWSGEVSVEFVASWA